MAKLLIVEDDRILNDAYRARFENEYDLKIATDGEDGIKQATKWRPDIILLDIYLQNKINGVDVLRALRGIRETQNIPVLVITNLPDMKETVFGLGAYGCLMKSDVDLNSVKNELDKEIDKLKKKPFNLG